MIDLPKARELLKAAVETQGPDFKYCVRGQKCFYEPLTEELVKEYARENPSIYVPENDNRRLTACLVGVALSLGGASFHLGSEKNIKALASVNPTEIDWVAGEYFYAAQCAQDQGETWGSAYEAAESYVAHQTKSATVQ